MTQVIVYANENGNVSVCYPTGELPIDEVLEKDCPAGAIITSFSELPSNDDDFFNAWRLIDGSIVVDLESARVIHLERFNTDAAQVAAERAKNASIGISNAVSDSDFIADLSAKRLLIANAQSTAELRVIKV